MSRNYLAAIGATFVVVAVVILGFRVLGGPSTQRLAQADLRTVRAMALLAAQIELKWNGSNKGAAGQPGPVSHLGEAESHYQENF
jgi:hypothetical protein